MENAKELSECLCCGSKQLTLVMDLGEQPLANSFIDDTAISEYIFPLQVNLCTDCTHLQLSHAVNPDLMFKNYLYVSGTSKTLRDYFDSFAKSTLDYFTTPPTTMLDIACNDGSQLNSFKTLGLKTYGIDPATNLYLLSSANHEVICDYFTQEHVATLKDKHIDIINAQNVFAHTSYPLEFLTMCKEIMHDNSRLFLQTSQANMVHNDEFDTVYHEHLSFFNVASMQALATRAGLYLIDVVKTPIHGISYKFVFATVPDIKPGVEQHLEEERVWGLQDIDTYTTWAEKCQRGVDILKEKIKEYRAEGYVIAGYGAAAKGMTLLNFGQIQLDFIIDDNPLKQNLFTPGMHIPVLSIDILKEVEDMNVVFVPLAWNFFHEISENIKTARNKEDDVFLKYAPGN